METTTSGTARPEANGTNGHGRRAKEPTKAELKARLEEAQARAELAEAGLLARRIPGDHMPEALLAPAKGVCRWWVMTDEEAYRLSLLSMEPVRWCFRKWSDGTRYTVEEQDGQLRCSCPGFQAYGMAAHDGAGCKHVRLLRAGRQLLDPGL